MEARAKVLGHAIHQMLVVFPLGLFATAVIFDVVHLIGSGPIWSTVAFWMIGAGIIGGLSAAVFGIIDWLAIPLLLLSGRLGGELVDRLGVGVDDGANVNAPSSLTHKTVRP